MNRVIQLGLATFGRLWDDSRRTTASMCILCNWGIWFPCVSVNTLSDRQQKDFLFACENQSILQNLAMFGRGGSGAHQPSEHRLNKLFLTLTISSLPVPPSVLSSPHYLISPSLRLVNTDLWRGLCLPQPSPKQAHASAAGGVSFMLHQV